MGPGRPAPTRCLQRALDEVHPGRGVLFGRSGWTGQHATGHTWAGDQASDFWSLRVLVVATLAAAASGFSNWSHDVGGYLGHRLVERCPPELLVALGAVRLLHAADARPRPDAPGAVALRRATCSTSTARTCCCTSSSCRTCGRRRDGRAHRAADHAAAVPDRSWRPARLDDHRRLRLRAVRCGSRRCSRRRRGSARSLCRAGSGSRPGLAPPCEGGGEVLVPAPLQPHPRLGARRVDRATYPAEQVADGPRRHSRVRAAAGGDAVGRAAPRRRDGTSSPTGPRFAGDAGRGR